jgi:hypothetical protein
LNTAQRLIQLRDEPPLPLGEGRGEGALKLFCYGHLVSKLRSSLI